MKTSIFDMNFVLPPMVEMAEVEKELAVTVLGDQHATLAVPGTGC